MIGNIFLLLRKYQGAHLMWKTNTGNLTIHIFQIMLKDHKQLPQAKGVWVFAHKYVQYLCICHDSYLYNYYIYIIMYHTYSGAKTQAPVSQEAFRFVSLQYRFLLPGTSFYLYCNYTNVFFYIQENLSCSCSS